MCRPAIMEVGDVDGPSRSVAQVGRTEPRVVGIQPETVRLDGHGAGGGLHAPGTAGVTQEVAAEKSTSECCRQRVTTVDRPAGCWTTGQAPPEHRLKMAVRVQVMQRTVLGEALGKVASLDGVQEQATVGTVEQPANLIEGESVEVAAALAEQFEPIRRRVIPPAPLLELDPADPAGRRAAIDPVQPASRSPRQVVGQGLGCPPQMTKIFDLISRFPAIKVLYNKHYIVVKNAVHFQLHFYILYPRYLLLHGGFLKLE